VADTAPFGQYVEARNAAVYGGACHYNGELTTGGESALLAWSLDGGVYHGVTLAGVDVVAAVAASDNLKSDAARTSVIYVDARTNPAQRVAVERWLREAHGSQLGEVLAVETVPLSVDSDGESFRAQAGDAIELVGMAMPDRECCKMPYNVWYEPFEQLDNRLVAQTTRFAWRETRLAAAFERADNNDAFVGAFGKALGETSCCSMPTRRARTQP